MAGAVGLFVLGLVLVVYTTAPGDGVTVLARDRVAVLKLRGMITDDHIVLRQLRTYRDDSSVKGYVVWIDSPGGEVAASQTLYRELARRSEAGTPVVAVIGSLGASGAYYAALGADTILAMPGSLVGSIGVLLEFPVAEKLLEKIGLSYEVIKSAEHKDVGSPYREATEADRAVLQEVVDDAYNQFLDAIAAERGLPRDSVMRVADGRLLSGLRAVEYGLIDGEGDLADGIAMAGRLSGLGSDPRTVTREERRVTWFDLLTSLAGWAAGREGATLGGIEDLWPALRVERGPRLFYLSR